MPTERVRSESVEFDVRTDEMLINMGPQHPSTHGVLRLVLRTDGEVVTEVTPHIGYLHRFAREDRRKPHAAAVPALHRPARLPGRHEHESRLGAVRREAPGPAGVGKDAAPAGDRSAELSRIANHLVAAGCYGLDLGSFTPFMWTFREREKILDLFEEVCGARLTYSYITVGGVTADLPAGWLEQCEAFLDQFEPVIDDLHALLTNNAIFIHRTAGIGVLPAGNGHRLRLHRPGAARQRRRLGPAPRRRAALHRHVRGLHLRGHRRRRTASIRRTTPIRPCRPRPWWATVGTATSCGCSKWCSRCT